MFGIGTPELIILGVIAVVAIIVLAVGFSKRRG